MPQLAPYNWLIMFLLFNMLLIFINSYNHFMFMKLKIQSTHLPKFIIYKWMW